MKYHQTSLLLAAAWICSVKGHLRMKYPPPFKINGAQPDVAPLANGESPLPVFPCQAGVDTGKYTGDYTKVAAGSSIPLRFTGTTVHHGGSCQLALASKLSSEANDWKVIHSIVGGCPSTYDGGRRTGLFNLLGVAGIDGAECDLDDMCKIGCKKQYSIPIPISTPPGKYYFSWTWFNKVGGRAEMYQNCAPVEVTGDANKADQKTFNSLPALFIANIPGKCVSANPGVLEFPNPGQSVIRSSHAWDQPAPNGGLGNCTRAKRSNPIIVKRQMDKCGGSFAEVADREGSPDNSGSSPAPAVAPPPPPPVGQAPQNLGTQRFPDNKSPPSPVAAPAPVVQQAPAIQVASGQMCELRCKSGELHCFDEKTFGLCNSQGCALRQQVALGTKCKGGAIAAGKRTAWKFRG